MPEESSNSPSLGLRVFLRWAGSPFALVLPQGMACEVQLGLRESPVPGAPDWVAGLINRQGAFVPVLAMANPWSGEMPSLDDDLLVLTQGTQQLGIRSAAKADFAPAAMTKAGETRIPDAIGVDQPSWFKLGPDGDALGMLWDPLRWARGKVSGAI